MSPPYNRRHDVAVVNEGRVDWGWSCLTCGASRFGYMTMTAAEDKADEHALTAEPLPDGPEAA